MTLTGEYNDNGSLIDFLAVPVDCINSTEFTLNLEGACECDKFEVTFGGYGISLIQNGGVVQPDFFGEYKPGRYTFHLDDRHKRGGQLEVILDCTIFGVTGSRKFNIRFLNQGDTYDVPLNQEQTYCNKGKPVPGQTSFCNCGIEDKKILTLESSNVNTVSSTSGPTEVTITGVYTYNEHFSIEASYNLALGNTTTTGTNSTLSSTTTTFPMEGVPNVGECIDACFKICHKTDMYKTYVVNCNEPDTYIGVPTEKIVPGSFNVGFMPCNSPYKATSNQCPSLLFKIKRGGNRFFAGCNGDLEVEIISGSPNLNFNWKGPFGFKSSSKNLSNVPSGIYTLTVSDECCNVVTEEFFLCPMESQFSSWVFDATSGKWCADFNCGDGVSRSPCLIHRCVDPDRIEQFFDDGKCKEKHYYKGEILGITIGEDAKKETEYDDLFGECIYKYYCGTGSSPLETISSIPDREEWIYDEFDNECHLNVVCDGVLFEDVDQISPEIDWDWDEFESECKSNFIKCDGTEVNGEITSEPYEFGEWDDLLLPSSCIRDIVCVNGGEIFEDSGELSGIEDGQDDDCNGEFNYYKIYCDEEFVKRICSEANPSFKNNQFENRQSSKVTILQFNKTVYIKLEKSLPYSVIEIFDVLSKSVIRKSTEKFEEIKIDMQNFPDGFYYIRVANGSKSLAGKKIIIY